jgi:flagellin
MSLSVLNNIPSLVAQNQLQVTNTNLQNTLFQLSSGSRINTGADDAAGLAIVNGLQANISALQQSSANASNGVGKLQVADGALAQVTTLLNRAVTLATESANGTVSQLQRQALNAEFTSIQAEITRIGNATNFNGTAIFSSTTVANPDQVASSKTTDVMAGMGLTATDTTTVALGNATPYTFTPTLTAHTDLNQLSGGAVVTGATTIAGGETLTISSALGGTSYAYTAAGGGDTVTGLIAAINTDGQFNAFLSGTGHVTITDAQGNGDVAVSANTATELGAITNVQTGSTVQDLINGINANVSGVTAGLASVTSLNQLSGATAGLTGATVIAAAEHMTISSTLGGAGDTYTYTAPGGADTVTGMMTAINADGHFHAFLNSTGNLQIVDTNYHGDVAVSANTVAEVGAVTNAAPTQLVITDTQNRGNLTVTNSDTALGFVTTTNPDAFVSPQITGAQNTDIFITDGNVTNPLYNTISVAIGALDDSHMGSASIHADSLYSATSDAASITVAKTALGDLNTAISQVANLRGGIGAGINRLGSAVNVMNTQVQNLTSAASAIKDADVGQVVANLSKYQVLEQTGIAALAQANSQEQAVLKLLQ